MATFGSATLVLEGPKGGTTIELSGTRVTVGRDPGCGTVVTDPAVSGTHCEFVKEKDALTVRDLGSSNGTYVNGQRIQATSLYDGDVVQLGQLQGTIAVRQPNGKPLPPPPEGSGVAIVLSVLALLLIGASAGVFWMIRQKTQERAAFSEFEQRAQTFLQLPSPCELARTEIEGLGPGTDLVVPAVAKPGHLKPAELDAHRALLQRSESRENTLKAIVTRLDNGPEAEKRREQLRALRAYEQQFKDPVLTAAMKEIQAALVQQVEDGQKFKEGLDLYVKSLDRFNAPLRKIAAGDERAVSDLEPPQDAGKPAELLRSCEGAFDKTTASAFVRLANVPL